MKSTYKLVSGLVALCLVVLGVAWAVPRAPAAAPLAVSSRTVARAAAGQAAAADAAGAAAQSPAGQVFVSEPSVPAISRPARDLPPPDDLPSLDREMARKDTFGFVGPGVQGPAWLDPLVELQRQVQAPGLDAFTTPLTNWPGMDYNVFPPDTTGDVGPNHVVQAVNGSGGSTVRIWNKSGTVLATFAMESLASGTPCNAGYCDPIVIYDSLADRWFISEFADTSAVQLCLYVSTSPDPTGTWYAYSFDPAYYDYPKYGVWPDAYYMGYNGGTTGTRQVFAFDRARMLAGQPATYQMFTVPSLSNLSFQLLVPASLESPTAPPAGAPGLFMRPRDTEVSGPTGYASTDFMEMWAFHVDWTTPANSTLTELADVPIAEYDCSLCGTGSDWSCMPQPGTTQAIDPIREPLHQPLQYRNWGTYETLVGGFAEDVDGTDKAAVRWFELRRTGGAWSAYQEGVVGGADAHHRSVTSVAMDGTGSIALGYTRTSSTLYPSILYAGRRSWDPLNTMTYVDALAQAGDSSQSTYERWGDYSGIGVDPSDDCTFWYTTEYMSGGSSATRVISFRFDADFQPDASPNTLGVCAPADAVYTVTTAKTCAFNGQVTMSAGGLPGGTTASWSANPVTPPGSTTLTIGNTGAAAAGTYNIDIIGTAGALTHQTGVILNVYTTAPAAATLTSPADGTTGVATAPTFTWSDVAGESGYTLDIATDPGFAAIVHTAALAANTTSYSGAALSIGTLYYWRVTAVNACGGVSSATWAFRTVAPSCLTYTSTDVPKIISNRTTIYSNLLVADSFSVTDVNVTIGSIVHTRDQDLDIYIEHPDNTAVELSTDNGVDNDNYTNTVFDDAAATAITAGSAPFTGSFRPEGSLAGLDAKTSNGTWQLRIYDDANQNTGTLNSWSLTLCGAPSISADYSDLASGYGVAWHTGTGALRLGSAWTADTGFSAGSDNASDDGVSFLTALRAGQPATVRVNVQGAAAYAPWLRLWFDWNNDGIFGDEADGERVHNALAVVGDNDITVNVPSGFSQSVNYRLRLYDSSGAPLAQDTGSYGAAAGGEVEDGPTPGPTSVRVTRFQAWPLGGAVHVEWETATEVDNLGFNLYRSDAGPDGPYVRLNELLIPSLAPGSPSGALYTWPDAGVRPGVTYYYQLENVDVYGASTPYGPVWAAVPYRRYLPAALK